ncbi:MAG: class I SAM-dependent methyltransferase [Lentisphaerae bacterium]|nr:class I SAM-dependent methyltransferase [Lentisphaerota bacterium]
MSQDTQQLTVSPFPETADIETSSDDYATRFTGSTGEWMLSVQEKITLRLLKSRRKDTILDVGGGHGQLAIPLCRNGYSVTVLGSSESCRKRISDIVDSGQCLFRVGNVIDLPFRDNSFDTVISFRMLTHCTQWPVLVRELCRVARQYVIVDYPTSQSVNAIAPMLFEAKRKIETNTRTWKLFKHRQVRDEFEKNEFVQNVRKPQFLLPMVLHRLMRCRTLSASAEYCCALLGLTALWGSPVIVEFVKKEHSPLQNSSERLGKEI